MRKKYGFEIGIIIALLVLSLILYGIYLIYDIYTTNKSYTLLLSPYYVLNCTNFKCTSDSINLDKYNDKNYKVYIDGLYVGENNVYYNRSNDKFYVFDKSNNNINNNSKTLFAYDGKAKISGIRYNLSTLSDSELNNISNLLETNLREDNVKKISLDFDNDGNIENLYSINYYRERNDVVERLSTVIYYDNDKYNTINFNAINNYEIGFTDVTNILDVFDDGKLEFIYNINFLDQIGSCNILFRLKGNKFVKANECEIYN